MEDANVSLINLSLINLLNNTKLKIKYECYIT